MELPQLEQLPFLASLCWQGAEPTIAHLSELDILHLYERNWRLRGVMADLSETEVMFIRRIAAAHHSIFCGDRDSAIQFPREIRTDRDGIRFPIQIDDTLIKFEIVAEGRIELNPPSQPSWSPVACLDLVDQLTEKLMANGDHWADASTHARDLIDLAWLRLVTDFHEAAIAKAEAVYPCVEPLKQSILNFQAKPDFRSRCYAMLQIESPKQVVDGLDRLAQQFLLPLTDRQSQEI